MSEKLVKKVMTKDGAASIDYLSLANLPTIDDTVIESSNNAVSGKAIYNALMGKLDVDGTAKNSEKFNGQAPEYYATAQSLQALADELGLKFNESTGEIEDINNILSGKLDADAQAVDSAKLGGQDPSYYATATAASNAQTTADAAMSSATSAGNTATSALNKANAAMPKANFSFNANTATLDIIL